MKITVKKVFSSHFDKYLSKINKIYSLHELYHQMFIIINSFTLSTIFLIINYFVNISREINLLIFFVFLSYFLFSVFYVPRWFFSLIKKEKIYIKYKLHNNLCKKDKRQLILYALNEANKNELLFYRDYINKKLNNINQKERNKIIQEASKPKKKLLSFIKNIFL